jgi:hypothetical protein
MRENDDGGVFNQVHCKHIWKCHNGTPLYNQYTLIKMLKILKQNKKPHPGQRGGMLLSLRVPNTHSEGTSQ